MTSKFEQLIEYVINDEEAKAKELFHDIVVEKSREIYENLMTEEEEEVEESKHEEMDEAEALDEESTHDEDEKAEKAGRKVTKDIEYDDKKDRKEKMNEEEDEDMEESMMADETAMMDDEELMNDVEMEEEGLSMSEGEGEEDLEDRVVDLEDKLDELMAEFEALMGDEGKDEVGDMDGGDDLEMDDTETADFDMGGEEGEEEKEVEMSLDEAVNLAKAPAPVTSEPAGTNTKSTNANNSGAKGAVAKPVKMVGDTAEGRPAPKAGELIGKVQNSVGGDKKLTPATKPHLAQATGVNNTTPFPKA